MRYFAAFAMLLGIAQGSVVFAQQVTVTAPATSISSDYSEHFRFGFGINHKNFSLNFGGPGRAPFGGGGFGTPLEGLSFGLPLGGGSVNGNLSIEAAQGFSRSMTTTAPTMTLTNGVPGFMFSGTVEPFITGLFPVVGAGGPTFAPPPVSRIRSLLDSGQIELTKDESGNAKLVVNEIPTRRSRTKPDADVEAETVRSDTNTSNSFRRALEKYAAPKR
jgi:hypothetical protein